MALEEYIRKRDFKKTPEPSMEKAVSRKGFSYLTQKHDAKRLHYDLRLELDGVLMSWAVTKGPSFDPSDKRLAVHVEDHPLSYGAFEGTIPKRQCCGGTVMLWDKGSWEPKGDPHGGLKNGHLAFNLHGERLKGGWDLIRIYGDSKKENWLLIKKKDDKAINNGGAGRFLEKEAFSITIRRSMDEIAVDAPPAKKTPEVSNEITRLMKEYPGVQLATLVDVPPEGDQWLHEIKFDGYRLLAFFADGEVRLRTRNGNDWTHKFPSLYASVTKLKVKSVVLDMEAVVLDGEGRSNFQAIQQALGQGGDRQSMQGYIFDLLHLDGRDMRIEALTFLKKTLKTLLKKSREAKYLHYSDHVVGHGAEMIAKSCSMGLEGIVSKLKAAPYLAGRQKSWLKSKFIKRQEFVIIGYTAARKGSRAIGALHLAYYDKGEMKYAGKAGTGFDMKGAQGLFDRLVKLNTNVPPLRGLPGSILKTAHWVRPALLCEVSFTEWTGEGHIRHPSFQGLREDKKPQEVSMKQHLRVNRGGSEKKKEDRVEVIGVTISHPDRVIFEDLGVTKGELAEYYAAAAPWILKDIPGHPVSLLRCPEGIAGDCFLPTQSGHGTRARCQIV
jgi:bifunctional non-homologous end joining protein LigD